MLPCTASPDSDRILNLKMAFLMAQKTTLHSDLQNIIPTQGGSFALQTESNQPPSSASIFIRTVYALTCSPEWDVSLGAGPDGPQKGTSGMSPQPSASPCSSSGPGGMHSCCCCLLGKHEIGQGGREAVAFRAKGCS